MTRRLFLGIPIPPSAKTYLFESISPLRGIHPQWRWVDRENYHITISFFGEVEENHVPVLESEITRILNKRNQFWIELDSLTLAPPAPPQRMLWATGTDSIEFSSVLKNIEKSVSNHIPLPNYRKNHKPIPHVTLARFEKGTQTNITLPSLHIRIPVTSCILFESIRSDDGPTYRIYKTFPLSEGD